MAKATLHGKDAKHILRTASRDSGWTLCVGAGISRGIFPMWYDLVQRIVSNDIGLADPNAFTKELSARYSLESIIEAACDRLGLNQSKYLDLLAKELYRDFMVDVGPDLWPGFAKCLRATYPAHLSPYFWKPFFEYFRTKYAESTIVALAEILIDSHRNGTAPSAVMSFNAEPLLFSLVNALSVERSLSMKSKGAVFACPPAILSRNTHSVSNLRKSRIPFFYAHGLLPIPGVLQQKWEFSTDLLVFSEHEYLQLANNAFAWQSTSFLNWCTSSVIVFVGVSLSDQNMRRWLTWAHANRCNELSRMTPGSMLSTRHFWIEVHPGSDAKANWMESLVAHLGVRIIWLQQWNELGPVLRQLLS